MDFYLDYNYKGSINTKIYVESTPISTFCYNQYGEQMFYKGKCSAFELINFLDDLKKNKYV
jgi:hypothetical protein